MSVNTAAVQRPELIGEIAQDFGNQCVVCAIDAKRVGDDYEVFVHGGRTATGIDAREWAQQAVLLGAGEILLTSMDRDGTREGFDIALIRAVVDVVDVPVIASGVWDRLSISYKEFSTVVPMPCWLHPSFTSANSPLRRPRQRWPAVASRCVSSRAVASMRQ